MTEWSRSQLPTECLVFVAKQLGLAEQESRLDLLNVLADSDELQTRVIAAAWYAEQQTDRSIMRHSETFADQMKGFEEKLDASVARFRNEADVLAIRTRRVQWFVGLLASLLGILGFGKVWNVSALEGQLKTQSDVVEQHRIATQRQLSAVQGLQTELSKVVGPILHFSSRTTIKALKKAAANAYTSMGPLPPAVEDQLARSVHDIDALIRLSESIATAERPALAKDKGTGAATTNGGDEHEFFRTTQRTARTLLDIGRAHALPESDRLQVNEANMQALGEIVHSLAYLKLEQHSEDAKVLRAIANNQRGVLLANKIWTGTLGKNLPLQPLARQRAGKMIEDMQGYFTAAVKGVDGDRANALLSRFRQNVATAYFYKYRLSAKIVEGDPSCESAFRHRARGNRGRLEEYLLHAEQNNEKNAFPGGAGNKASVYWNNRANAGLARAHEYSLDAADAADGVRALSRAVKPLKSALRTEPISPVAFITEAEVYGVAERLGADGKKAVAPLLKLRAKRSGNSTLAEAAVSALLNAADLKYRRLTKVGTVTDLFMYLPQLRSFCVAEPKYGINLLAKLHQRAP